MKIGDLVRDIFDSGNEVTFGRIGVVVGLDKDGDPLVVWTSADEFGDNPSVHYGYHVEVLSEIKSGDSC